MALVACGVDPVVEATSVAEPEPVTLPPPQPAPKPRDPVVPSVHALAIKMLATTEDGSAALTSDQRGSLRLWPTLDGTREPVVVHGPLPIDLALGRTTTGGLVAGLVDQANVLTIIHLDSDGHALDHAQVASDVRELHATPHGFLVRTSDMHVELVSYAGVTTLLPAKERVFAVVYRNDRALVLHESRPKHLRGRWVDLATATYGDETAELDLDAHHIELALGALSPDHTRLVVAGPGLRLLAFELSTAVVTSLAPLCDSLGYLDDDTVACSDGENVLFYDRKGKRVGIKRDVIPMATAVAGTHLAFGAQEAIGFLDATSARYLGYSVTSARKVRDSISGPVVSGNKMFLADDKLAFAKPFTDGSSSRQIDVLPLSAKVVAAVVQDNSTYENSLVINNKTVFAKMLDNEVHFEPSTGLVAEAAAGTVRFVRIEDDKLGKPFEFQSSTRPLAQYLEGSIDEPDTVYLTNPALADDRVAFIVHGDRVYELRAADVAAPPIHAAKSYEVALHTITAIDRLGHIFTKHKKSDVALRGTDVTFAGTADASATVPSPDGTLVAVTSPSAVALFSLDGKLRWRVTGDNRVVAWTRDNHLLALSGGMERLDLETGSTIERHCGWNFGFSTTPLDDGAPGDLVCER